MLECKKHDKSKCGDCVGDIEKCCFENDELKLLMLLRDCAVIDENESWEQYFESLLNRLQSGKITMIEISHIIYQKMK